VEDYYLSLGLGYEHSLSETTTLTLGGTVGLAGEDFAAFYAGGTDGGFFNYTLTAGINHALTEAWTVGASLSLSDRLDDDALPDEVVDTTVYGGVSLACTF
jgi:opacity protein-like surface antigen